ncbi:hypothetical protein MBLNU13_g05401t1 [Cladosporium sp. NU13]
MSGARTHGSLTKDEEVNAAAWAAGRGAVVGASKWAIFSAVAGLVAYQFSPLYRGLTFQFKVFLQMSGMTFGSIIEADRRLRIHGAWQRQQKKVLRDAEVWRRYEEDYELQSKSSNAAAQRVEGSDGKAE